MDSGSWSYSSYSTALQCLRKYQYLFIDKIVPDGPLSGDMTFGSALHSAINASLTGGDGPSTFELYWSSYREKDLEYGRYKWPELAQLGAEFIRKFIKYHAKHYELEFAESRLYADYRGVKFEGTLDFLGKYDGRRSLRDFKTSGRNYEQEKSSCAVQLYLYAFLAIRNALPLPETLGYTVFNKGTGSIQDLSWDFDEKKMYLVLDDFVAYTAIIETGADYPKNLNACLDYSRKCPFWTKCHSLT